MLQKLASASTRWSTRWVPDAWVIAVILTIVAYGLGLIFTKATGQEQHPVRKGSVEGNLVLSIVR